jgi:DNA helicase-2/ATP-dependent DNA helicase PcrA
LLQVFEEHRRVAVVGVPTRHNGDIRDLYGYVVEPAWRKDVELLIQADRPFAELVAGDFAEADFGYAWTFERLKYVMARYHRRQSPGLPPMTPIEERLYEAMRHEGLAPRLQYGIDACRVDFAFPELGLAVEADGRVWHDAARDARRDARLRSVGWEVLRFPGWQIVRDGPACAKAVALACRQRETEIRRSPTGLVDQTMPRVAWWRRVLGWFGALLRRTDEDAAQDGLDEMEGVSNEPPSEWLEALDTSQRAAVQAHDGVVQVIAPAGSGKTSVLVARVQELRARGVAANRILCCTFNKDAVDELRSRLSAIREEQPETRSFHGIGWKVLNEARQIRAEVRQTTYGEWRRLARDAMQATEGGEWIDAAEAQSLASRFKLGDLVTAEEAEKALNARPNASPLERTAVKLYTLHEQYLETEGRFDYDDLIFRAVRLLRSDAEARRDWQRKYDFVLVDEYQDIEPAQERLIQILAAPQDGLFCVGDEDQCIYAWRRASVERILELDRFYPGLQRFALAVNYRCPKKVVVASRSLIEHNQRRFEKSIEPLSAAASGNISLVQAVSLDAQLAEAARRAEKATRGELVVLARTTSVLREAAVALARRGLRIDAPLRVLSDSGADDVLVAYLRLFANLRVARAADVITVLRVPNRYLSDDRAAGVAARLRAGKSFAEALADADGGEGWRVTRLNEAAGFFDRLVAVDAADELIQMIRSEGGLDRHYADQQRLSPHDQSSIDRLESAQARAKALTVSEFADVLDHETHLIEAHLDPNDGIELRTIHGAKGREWPTVVLVGVDEGELPHLRTIAETDGDVEDERRLAYVALTRAQEELVLMCKESRPSRFITEAAVGQWATRVEPADLSNSRDSSSVGTSLTEA